MSTIDTVSKQWLNRPADQRFTSLIELDAHVQAIRTRSVSRTLSSRGITLQPVEHDTQSLVAVGPNGAPVNLTHWSFGQLAQRAGAPAGYLRDLPGPLAADCVNFGLQHVRDVEDLGILLHKPENAPAELRAVTGSNYGRVWNSTITKSLINQFGDGVTGDFKVPGEFGVNVPITRENTTLYASDRDLFVFLADEKNRIEVPNRRDGKSGSLARGLLIWNSEVGSTSFGIATVIFDFVCKNRLIWGAQEYAEIRLRHSAGAPDRWIEELAPAITAYANSSTDSITKAVTDARAARVDNVDEFLRKRFTNSQARAIQAAHLADEQRPIETLWDVSTGITAYARGIQYQNERVTLEREAGKVFALAA